jgi:hypothetical protein
MHIGESPQQGVMQLGQDHAPHDSQHTSPERQFEDPAEPTQYSPASLRMHSSEWTQPASGSKTLKGPQSHPASQQSSYEGSPHV